MIEVLVRGRFVELPEARARAVAGNAWEIDIPDVGTLKRKTRRGDRPEDWDGAVFLVDGRETEPGIGSGGRGGTVTVSVWAV